ncbi:uncharacterized protein LOC126252470 [Schistocerca nitens]|uniref:uncharacterized protein LOC126252470 n=1 Tax=Schistocerca nitens TaxID=7011 RepID=UPI002118E9BD|nr:uncharacterized protein LOC126252470 [Schistocerca nitens]
MVKIGMEARQVWGACAGVGSHWALGVLLLLGLAAEDWSGPAALLSLAIAFTVALLTATCGFRASDGVSCSGGSAGGRPPPPVAHGGDAGPDPVALAVAVVPALLCALGLESSWVLRLLLNAAVAAAVAFFVSVGSLHADPAMWAEHGAVADGLRGVASGAALCSYGFLGLASASASSSVSASTRPSHPVQPSRLSRVTLAVLLLASHCAVATLLAMLVHYRGLRGSAVPLLQVFEVRDVDWARVVMAACSVLAFALVMVEESGPMHAIVVSLAGEEVGALPRLLSRESGCTGTPVAAALSSGVAAAGLACACPLRALAALAALCPLVAHAVAAAGRIHSHYQPLSGRRTTLEAPSGAGRYCRLPSRREDEDSGDEEWSTRLRAGLGLALGRSRSEAALLDDADADADADAGAPSGASTPGASSLARLLGDDQVEVGAHTYTRRPASSLHLNGVYAVPAANGFANGEVFRPVANGAPCHVSTVLPANGHSDFSSVPPDWKKFSRNMAGKSPGADSRSSVTFPRDLFDSVDGQHSVRVIDINNSDDRLAYCKQRFPIGDSDVEDEEVTSSSEGSSEESSSTDIDAIVAEYKEKLQVPISLLLIRGSTVCTNCL